MPYLRCTVVLLPQRQSAGCFLAGTWRSCYAFWLLVKCRILIFFESYLGNARADFWSRGTGRRVDLLAFMLGGLKGEQCNFLRKISLALAQCFSRSNIFPPFLFLMRHSRWRRQNPTKSLKMSLLRQKDDSTPQIRHSNFYFIAVFNT